MADRTLFRNGVVYTGPAEPPASALAIEGEQIAWVGDEQDASTYEGAADVVDLHGAFVAPAFVDSHVHTVQAGFRLTELDLHGSPTRQDTLDRLARYSSAQPSGTVLMGQGWDETLWPDSRTPTGAELEQAAPGAKAFLGRIDGHSAIVSPALAASVDGLEAKDGWSGDGRVERDAHHAVRAVLGDLVGADQRLSTARAACARMVASGIAGFHENAAPHIGPQYELDLVRAAADETGLRATYYWGQLGAVDTARRLGVSGLAGDLNADGALGSRTAALHAPYADRPDTCGHAYLEPAQIAEHVVLCTEAGLQAGFHCIGDAAMDAIAEGFNRAAEKLGADRIRAGRHRLEHVELPSAEVIATIGRLGITASVQPMFDALWGGPDAMYAERLGSRWQGSNPFRALAAASVELAFGSDSPVTPIGPWAAVHAAVHHHDPAARLSPEVAFAAHTRGGWAAGRDDRSGELRSGLRADLAVWEPVGAPDGDACTGADWLAVLVDEPPRLARTVGAGRTLFHQQTRHDAEVTS